MRLENHSRRLSIAEAQQCQSQAKANGKKGYGHGSFNCGDTVHLRGFRYLLVDLQAEGDTSRPILLSLEGDCRNLVDASDVTWDRLTRDQY